ncbi:zinc metallopeptidase [Phreatobacter stygius]|uniref:Zinc metallopeptidase n=1 Tax=Phreatobacter stygius TaxID=1940610 RepID=A0A4D7AZQ7_9HYPH|nr:zinc metallopeptidase [Phreatobacter stygius]QCI64253.1 zinc metallopeptidase [Phreatobacter stygius]
MPILIVLAGAAVLLLIFGPQFWVKAEMRRHAAERADFPGTGGELAEHLLERAGLAGIKVELTDGGDHYDPIDGVVRLSPDIHGGRSVTAVAVAAHEVGHALQHRDGDRLLLWRIKMAEGARVLEIGAAILFATAPLVLAFVHSLPLVILQIVVAVALLASRLVMHLLTLPVEFDASFGRALPILDKGGYLPPGDLPAAKSVLRAAAFTYVASALVTLLDVTRLIRILR